MCLTHYEVLGLSEKATPEEIKDMYKKLVLVYHPDKCSSNVLVDKFRRIQRAYMILSNGTSRAEYDRSRICEPIRKTVFLDLGEFMFGVRKKVKISRKIYENFEIKGEDKTFTIDVEAGTKVGMRYIFDDGDILPGKKPGKVIITLDQLPDSNFVRCGYDLIFRPNSDQVKNHRLYSSFIKIEIPTAAILGYDMSFSIHLLDNNNNAVKEKKFPGLGFPVSGDFYRRGDLVRSLLSGFYFGTF
jgi:DnaJ-class molecular chaperone